MKKRIWIAALIVGETAALIGVGARLYETERRVRIISNELYLEPDPLRLSAHHANVMEDHTQTLAEVCNTYATDPCTEMKGKNW